MSDPQTEEHGAFIKTPNQLMTVVVLAFTVPIFIIVLLISYVGGGTRSSPGSQAYSVQAIEARIAPVARVELKDAANKVAASGEQVYKAQCAACHNSGAAGAPKLGDAAAWAPRLKTGFEALWQSSLKGKGAMGAQAGGEYDDVEIGKAVVYLANAAGGKFEDPKPATGSGKAEGDKADKVDASMADATKPSSAKAADDKGPGSK